MKLTDEVRELALAHAYRVFDARRWEQVRPSDRGAVFDSIVSDPDFNKLLRPFLTPSQMRVWLKDSVAKEYPRALEGVGRTSQYTRRRYPGPEVVARSALGEGWSVAAGSIKTKPMRCEIIGGDDDRVLVLWGPLKSFRDLYWAASGARVAVSGRVVIALTRPSMEPFPDEEWKRAQALCDLIGVEVYSVMYAPRALSCDG